MVGRGVYTSVMALFGADLSGFRSALRQVRRDTGVLSAQTGAMSQNIGRNMTYMITAPLIAFSGASIAAFSAFEKGMRNIASISPEIASNFDEVSRAVQDFGAKTSRGQTEAARALYEITSAGIIEQAKAMNTMEHATKLAEAGLSDTGETAKAVAVTLNALSGVTDDVAKITDVWLRTVQLGVGELPEFVNAQKYIGPLVGMLKEVEGAFEETFGLWARYTQTGAEPHTAARGINRMFVSLYKPTEKLQKIMDRVKPNITFKEMVKDSGGIYKALVKLRSVMETDADLWTMTTFGSRAFIALTNDIQTTEQALADFNQGIEGAAHSAWEEQAKTFTFRMGRMNSEFQRVSARLGEKLVEVISPIIDSVTEIFDFLGGLPQQGFDFLFDSLFKLALVGPLLWALAKPLDKIAEILRNKISKVVAKLFPILKKPFIFLKNILTGTIRLALQLVKALVMKVVVRGIVLLAKTIKTVLVGAIKILIKSLLFVIIKLVPKLIKTLAMKVVVKGVVLLAKTVVILAKTIKTVLVGAVKILAKSIWFVIKRFGFIQTFVKHLKTLKTVWKTVFTSFANNPALKNFEHRLNLLRNRMQALPGIMKLLLPVIKTIAKFAGIFAGLRKQGKGIFGALFGTLKRAVVDLVKGLYNIILSAVKNIVKFIKIIPTALFGALKVVFSVLKTIASTIKKTFDGTYIRAFIKSFSDFSVMAAVNFMKALNNIFIGTKAVAKFIVSTFQSIMAGLVYIVIGPLYLIAELIIRIPSMIKMAFMGIKNITVLLIKSIIVSLMGLIVVVKKTISLTSTLFIYAIAGVLKTILKVIKPVIAGIKYLGMALASIGGIIAPVIIKGLGKFLGFMKKSFIGAFDIISMTVMVFLRSIVYSLEFLVKFSWGVGKLLVQSFLLPFRAMKNWTDTIERLVLHTRATIIKFLDDVYISAIKRIRNLVKTLGIPVKMFKLWARLIRFYARNIIADIKMIANAFASVSALMVKAINRIYKVFDAVMPVILNLVSVITSGILSAMNILSSVLFNVVKTVLINVFNAIKTVIPVIVNFLKTSIVTIAKVIGTILEKTGLAVVAILNKIAALTAKIVSVMIKGFIRVAKALKNYLVKALKLAFSGLKLFAKFVKDKVLINIWRGLKAIASVGFSGLKFAINGIRSALTKLLGVIKSVGKSLLKNLSAGFFQGVFTGLIMNLDFVGKKIAGLITNILPDSMKVKVKDSAEEIGKALKDKLVPPEVVNFELPEVTMSLKSDAIKIDMDDFEGPWDVWHNALTEEQRKKFIDKHGEMAMEGESPYNAWLRWLIDQEGITAGSEGGNLTIDVAEGTVLTLDFAGVYDFDSVKESAKQAWQEMYSILITGKHVTIGDMTYAISPQYMEDLKARKAALEAAKFDDSFDVTKGMGAVIKPLTAVEEKLLLEDERNQLFANELKEKLKEGIIEIVSDAGQEAMNDLEGMSEDDWEAKLHHDQEKEAIGSIIGAIIGAAIATPVGGTMVGGMLGAEIGRNLALAIDFDQLGRQIQLFLKKFRLTLAQLGLGIAQFFEDYPFLQFFVPYTFLFDVSTDTQKGNLASALVDYENYMFEIGKEAYEAIYGMPETVGKNLEGDIMLHHPGLPGRIITADFYDDIFKGIGTDEKGEGIAPRVAQWSESLLPETQEDFLIEINKAIRLSIKYNITEIVTEMSIDDLGGQVKALIDSLGDEDMPIGSGTNVLSALAKKGITTIDFSDREQLIEVIGVFAELGLGKEAGIGITDSVTEEIQSEFNNVLKSIPIDITAGLVIGINTPEARGNITESTGKIKSWINEDFEASSPSQWAIRLGKNVIRSLATGFMEQDIEGYIKSKIKTIMNTFTTLFGMGNKETSTRAEIPYNWGLLIGRSMAQGMMTASSEMIKVAAYYSDIISGIGGNGPAPLIPAIENAPLSVRPAGISAAQMPVQKSVTININNPLTTNPSDFQILLDRTRRFADK